ncbi:hypothetical protein SAMN02800691_1821 [Luteibacter sp. UNCMF366Tsu5.1]|uniref:Blp family class II bacteriocin n=1 Tax=Luteibacter flocculans TaxID=2780091 RepID=A0ABY4SZ71_9GAMM|nr:Blp family class II bacteriocin [Luteibacter flocculans]SFW43935.1 hypothetical protein SAMN02800691_1821 [Luteibacter sp. UNCMF366Tsu5.1]
MRELTSPEIASVSGGRLKVPGACSRATLLSNTGVAALGGGITGLITGGPLVGLGGAIFGGSMGALSAAVSCGIALREAR